MLVLELRAGEGIKVFDLAQNEELGTIRFLKPHQTKANAALLGFDFDRKIQLTREELVNGKESRNGSKRQ